MYARCSTESTGGVTARDFDFDRLTQQVLRQPPDVVGVRRGEHQVLPARRQQLDHAADVRDESHVQHAVRFVEHQDLHLRQIDRALLRVIEQAARRRHQNVGAAAQAIDLRIDADAAEDDLRAQPQVLAVGADAFVDLRGELAGRHEHERTWRFRRVSRAVQELQDRQREAGGLAGSGLRAGQDVPARKNFGNHARLNGRGFGIAALGERTRKFGHQPERSKRHVSKNPLPARMRRWSQVQSRRR